MEFKFKLARRDKVVLSASALSAEWRSVLIKRRILAAAETSSSAASGRRNRRNLHS